MRLHATTSWFISIALTILVLVYGQPIIVPFVFALLIWFVVKKTRNLIDKITFVHKYIPRWIKSILASFIIFSILVVVGKILIQNIESLALSYKTYASNIEIISVRISELFNVDLQEEIHDFVKGFNFSEYLTSLLNSLSDILGSMVMIIFYTVCR